MLCVYTCSLSSLYYVNHWNVTNNFPTPVFKGTIKKIHDNSKVTLTSTETLTLTYHLSELLKRKIYTKIIA